MFLNGQKLITNFKQIDKGVDDMPKPVILAMVTHNRCNILERCLQGLMATLDYPTELFIIDNNSNDKTREFLQSFKPKNTFIVKYEPIYREKNYGTARSINFIWKLREQDQHCIKMDDDCVIYTPRWLSRIVKLFNVTSDVGIIGLKRLDLEEWPNHENSWYKSYLQKYKIEGRHEILESCPHVMGTCQVYKDEFLNKFGYLDVLGSSHLYGFDDSLASVRAHILNYKTCFISGVSIDHIDPGGDEFTNWKKIHSNDYMKIYMDRKQAYESGLLSPYVPCITEF